ncbi:MAG: hypothetical protein LBC12_00940 [Nitrososphaerota archaeon]|jgi:hypothetical protein|nr:hypothetical protein [Nitrososphaerota archaeon]
MAINDTVVLKKTVDKSFQETLNPIWKKVRQMGLTEENIDAIIEEVRT